MRLILLVVCCFFQILIPAQQPAHFIWGAEELEGIEIYGIHHHSNGDYWIASDAGVIYHDGYKFHKLECKEMLGSSVFSLVEDSNGNIYCNNLSGQVFRIKNTVCQLYYQIPDEFIGSDMSIIIDDQNELIITTKSLLRVTTGEDYGELVSVEDEFGYYYYPCELEDGSILVNTQLGDLVQIRNGITTCVRRNKKMTNQFFFYFQNELYGFDRVETSFVRFNENFETVETIDLQFMNNNSFPRIYSSNEKVWIADLSVGLYELDSTLLTPKNKIFKNTFISTVCKDNSGNLLLGTFGEGIIVVSNHFAFEENTLEATQKIKRVTRTKNGALFLGAQDGQIYRLDSNGIISNFQNKKTRNVETLYYLEGTKELLVGQGRMILINEEDKTKKELFEYSIKDVFPIYDNQYLIATNLGCFYYDPERKNRLSKMIESSEFLSEELKSFRLFDGRSYSVGFDSVMKSIYVGSAKGLKILQENQELLSFKLNENSVSAKDICFHKGKVYVGTQKNGILIFQQNKLIDHWSEFTGLVSNHISQIQIYDNRIYLGTSKGLQILEEDGSSVHLLDASSGIYSSNIIDFSIVNDQIWIVHNKRLQYVNLKSIKDIDFKPEISIKKVFINGKPIDFNRTTNFGYNQRNISFELYSFSLQHYSNLKYKYQLIGADNKVQYNEHSDNVIEYKSLSPGNYTLKVSSVWRENESEEIEFSFTIASPFWLTWWFYLALALGFLTIISIYFWYRLRAHRKKAAQINELNTSKLTAIQSQMNPHFIFNALNSIQDLVLKGDIDNSYTYITKFANLVRRTLNYSDKDFIEFESEIKLIELYLTLEKLRFKKEFNYQINTNGIDDILVPPMLVQPFIENALVHGLLHKEGAKNIVIDFRLEEELVCVITDNGIGRAKAMEIKQRQRSEHESFSVNAIKKRFEILEDYFGGSLGFVYEDLEEDGTPIGTTVILRIPIKRVL